MGVNINASANCAGLGSLLDKFIATRTAAGHALSGCQIDIGEASDSRFGVPASAVDCAFIGDAAWIDPVPVCDAATKALFEADPTKDRMRSLDA